MFTEREVILSLDLEKLKGRDERETYKAIGYLSTWAIEAFQKVRIFTTHDNMIMAQYSTTDSGGDRYYVIGAVWNEKERTYSFHS